MSHNDEEPTMSTETTEPVPAPTWDELHAAAVAALTAATKAGYDMGEFICHVVTAAAANAGGAEALLSVRTGSWEADYVRQIVLSTAGDAVDHLAAYRTEPVRLYFDTEALYGPLGLEDLLHEEGDHNAQPINDAEEALPAGMYEPLPGPVRGWARLREDLSDEERAQVAAFEELAAQDTERFDRMEALYAADVIAYRANLHEAARHQLAANGLQEVPVEFVEGGREYDEPTYSELGDVLAAIEEAAVQRAVVPPLGRPLAEIEGSVVDAVRAAGLTYTERDAAGERAPQTGEEPTR
jgi:hypothetical protein